MTKVSGLIFVFVFVLLSGCVDEDVEVADVRLAADVAGGDALVADALVADASLVDAASLNDVRRLDGGVPGDAFVPCVPLLDPPSIAPLSEYRPDPEALVFDVSIPNEDVVDVSVEILKKNEDEVVWSARVSNDFDAIDLSRGTFSDGPLKHDKRYRVRARYRAAGEACESQTSEVLRIKTEDQSDILFPQDDIVDYHLTISPESMAAMDAQTEPPAGDFSPFPRDYQPVQFRLGDHTFINAGAHIKGGHGSATPIDEKPAFKIKLRIPDDQTPCPDDERLYGLKRITLNNMNDDPSSIRERLGYAFYEMMGVPAPRTSHVRLFVNDELWGLYLHVETIDRRYLSRRFESNDGMMYEGTYCDLEQRCIPIDDSLSQRQLEAEFTTDICDEPLDPDRDPTDFSLAQDLVDALAALPEGEFYPGVEAFFDFDLFLTTWAADTLINAYDAYFFRFTNNYRVYHHPPSNDWTLIPSGIDRSFLFQSGEEQGVPVRYFNVSGILAERCIAEADCEAALVEKLRLAIDVFDGADLDLHALMLRDQIEATVLADPRTPYSENAWRNNVQTALDFIDARSDEIRAQISSRGF